MCFPFILVYIPVSLVTAVSSASGPAVSEGKECMIMCTDLGECSTGSSSQHRKQGSIFQLYDVQALSVCVCVAVDFDDGSDEENRQPEVSS